MLRRYPTGEERCIACKLCEAVSRVSYSALPGLSLVVPQAGQSAVCLCRHTRPLAQSHYQSQSSQSTTRIALLLGSDKFQTIFPVDLARCCSPSVCTAQRTEEGCQWAGPQGPVSVAVDCWCNIFAQHHITRSDKFDPSSLTNSRHRLSLCQALIIIQVGLPVQTLPCA